MATSAVADALGMGAAKADVAYEGLKSAVDVVSAFKAKLVAAREPGVDNSKIQKELEQFKKQLVSISQSASFNGVNWLNTDAPQNLWELSSMPASIASSFIRSANNNVRVGTMDLDVADLSLFNAGGGGALQKGPGSLGDIGGFRNADRSVPGQQGFQSWPISGSVTLGASDTISFAIKIDNVTTRAIAINKATVDAALGTTTGTIGSAAQFATVLNRAFSNAGILSQATATSSGAILKIYSQETAPSNASSIAVTGVAKTPAGTVAGFDTTPATTPGALAKASFSFTSPFEVPRDASFFFDFAVDGSATQTASVSRDMVDAALGTADGMINSASALAAVLSAAVSGKGLHCAGSGSIVTFTVDPALYPKEGQRSRVTFGNATDSIDPSMGPAFDILDVDITDPANDLDEYISGVDVMLQKVITGASTLGAIKKRIDMQMDFTHSLMDAMDKGIGRLVDADMDEVSTRLKAQQTQQQLAIQSLQIANSNAQNILQLFQQS